MSSKGIYNMPTAFDQRTIYVELGTRRLIHTLYSRSVANTAFIVPQKSTSIMSFPQSLPGNKTKYNYKRVVP